MKCKFCGLAKTNTLTSLDKPICQKCAEEKGYIMCTELGKYIEDKYFVCDHNCLDCVHK